MLDVHVWGPAFGLASIDAECLAIVTYLGHAAPNSIWRLIPSNDASVSPAHLLPALHHDGVWTSGYRPIVRYLASNSLCRDLDEGLGAGQQADCVAYSAYLSAHAAPLVDLSLYVSAANWSAATRPAYTSLLPFPLTWTLPPLMRAEAIKRVNHLGLAELDTDFDPNNGLHLSAGRDALPETFRKHLPARAKKTVRGEMTPEQAAAIRLLGLVEACLSAVDALMAEGAEDETHPRFFAGTPLSSADCLAYGYLALMLRPPVPRPFLRNWLLAETPRLSTFVDDVTPGHLPWSAPAPEPATVIGSGARAIDSVMRNAPRLDDLYAREMRQCAEQGSRDPDKRMLTLAVSVAAAGAAVGYGLHLYRSLQPFGASTHLWRAHHEASKLSQFGELGSMLSSAMGAYGPAPSTGNMPAGNGRLVEVDSEVD